MSLTEQQYRTTRRELYKFERAMSSLLEQQHEEGSDDALFCQLQIDAMRSQIADLRAEVTDYEARHPDQSPLLAPR